MLARWTGSAWRVSKIADVGSRYGSGTVLLRGADQWDAYVAGEKWNGGEVREYTTIDGGQSWRHSRDLTRGSAAPNAFPRAVVNASPTLQVIWSSGDKQTLGRLHAWGEAGSLPDNPDPTIRE